jgi:hypothetical protein
MGSGVYTRKNLQRSQLPGPSMIMMLLIPIIAFVLTAAGAMMLRNKGWLAAWTIYVLAFALAFLQAVPKQTDGISASYLLMLVVMPIAAATIIGGLAGLFRLRKRGSVPLSVSTVAIPLLYAAGVGLVALWMLSRL